MNTDKPSFSFVHATDLHYTAGDNAIEPKANARVACLISDINTLNEKQPLSFIILSGDLTDRGSASDSELSEAKAFLESFDLPYYAVAGNHDFAPHRRFAAMYPGKEDFHDGDMESSRYAKIFGMDRCRFAFEKDGYHFIGVSLRDEDPDGGLDWLEKEIGKIKGQGIIVSHYGLYPPRDAGSLHEWGFARIGAILPRFRAIISRPDKKITAYLYGHNHINSVVKNNGTYHISGGGIQKGCTGYRVFDCYSDRIESSFHILSDKTLWDFNYWGREHPEVCIDSTHRTVEEYHRGNVEEQALTIPQSRLTRIIQRR